MAADHRRQVPLFDVCVCARARVWEDLKDVGGRPARQKETKFESRNDFIEYAFFSLFLWGLSQTHTPNQTSIVSLSAKLLGLVLAPCARHSPLSVVGLLAAAGVAVQALEPHQSPPFLQRCWLERRRQLDLFVIRSPDVVESAAGTALPPIHSIIRLTCCRAGSCCCCWGGRSSFWSALSASMWGRR